MYEQEAERIANFNGIAIADNISVSTINCRISICRHKEAKSSPRMSIAYKYALGFLLRKNKEDLKYGSITHYK